MLSKVLCLAVAAPLLVHSQCPFASQGTPPSGTAYVPELSAYNAALENLDVRAVFDDLYDVMNNSQSCWPADTFNNVSSYGPLFVRLGWHCSGSYRATDGKGGCGGGRQRFPPEADWEDNTNLDKARTLLAPVKNKYGDALSWGDTFIFAATAAILNMGGPATEVCYGRIDSADGNLSKPLGPGPEAPPCPVNGNCSAPLGTTTIGLIYVNPQGFMGNPDPTQSAAKIRDVFGRMGMNDTETVALIGGGHAFGKSHGACPNGAGPNPSQQPDNPWPGACGSGKGADTYTSGIEGPWTSDPLSWDNEYFKLLANGNYSLHKGPGDAYQWYNVEDESLMMMTTDLALTVDEEYMKIVQDYANDLDLLSTRFAAAWAKLVTDGGQWAQNKGCIDADKLKPASSGTSNNFKVTIVTDER